MASAATTHGMKLRRWDDEGGAARAATDQVFVEMSTAEEALKGRRDAPNEIWLVDTTIRAEWTVWCLMRDGLSFPDEETPFRYRDFKPNDLSDVGAA